MHGAGGNQLSQSVGPDKLFFSDKDSFAYLCRFIYVIYLCCIDLYISINEAHSLAFCLLLKFKPVIVTGIHSYISYLHSCVYFK